MIVKISNNLLLVRVPSYSPEFDAVSFAIGELDEVAFGNSGGIGVECAFSSWWVHIVYS